jgi:hypothetical protein
MSARRIAVNLGLFSAVNNIRTSAASYSESYLVDQFNKIDLTLAAQDQSTVTPVSPANFMCIKVSQPVFVDVQYATISENGAGRAAYTATHRVSSMLVIDDTVLAVTIRNVQSSETDVSIIQG